jgi:hypothetical protein
LTIDGNRTGQLAKKNKVGERCSSLLANIPQANTPDSGQNDNTESKCDGEIKRKRPLPNAQMSLAEGQEYIEATNR